MPVPRPSICSSWPCYSRARESCCIVCIDTYKPCVKRSTLSFRSLTLPPTLATARMSWARGESGLYEHGGTSERNAQARRANEAGMKLAPLGAELSDSKNSNIALKTATVDCRSTTAVVSNYVASSYRLAHARYRACMYVRGSYVQLYDLSYTQT